MKTCSISRCESISIARGWCSKHYQRWKTHGDPEYEKPDKLCTIPNCGEKHRSRGYCSKHLTRWYVHGDPLKSRPYYKESAESFAARTEWQGDCLIWSGEKDGNDYGVLTYKSKKVPAHRYAWEREHGEIPDGMLVDHKDHCNTLCVNVKHLRLATHQENIQNRSGATKNNKSSRIRNVYPTSYGSWFVRIVKNGVPYYFGTYTDKLEAARVAEEKRNLLFGEYSGRG